MPTACVPHSHTGDWMMPHSSISSFLVSSPTPFTVATPARAGSTGGTTTDTPVAWPLAAWLWPTRTPGTSVIAFRGPVGSRPTAPPMSRQRCIGALYQIGARPRLRPREGGLEGAGGAQDEGIGA